MFALCLRPLHFKNCSSPATALSMPLAQTRPEGVHPVHPWAPPAPSPGLGGRLGTSGCARTTARASFVCPPPAQPKGRKVWANRLLAGHPHPPPRVPVSGSNALTRGRRGTAGRTAPRGGRRQGCSMGGGGDEIGLSLIPGPEEGGPGGIPCEGILLAGLETVVLSPAAALIL